MINTFSVLIARTHSDRYKRSAEFRSNLPSLVPHSYLEAKMLILSCPASITLI